MKHCWTVTIPYYHKFTVVAETEEDAISLAHDQEGVIVGYDDNDAEVELADEVFGTPPEQVMAHRIIVLSDGETWESLEGDFRPEILEVTDEAYEYLEHGGRPRHLKPEEILKGDVVQ